VDNGELYELIVCRKSNISIFPNVCKLFVNLRIYNYLTMSVKSIFNNKIGGLKARNKYAYYKPYKKLS